MGSHLTFDISSLVSRTAGLLTTRASLFRGRGRYGASANNPAFRLLDELDDLVDLVAWRQFFANGFDGLTRVVFGPKEEPERFFN